MTRPRLSATQTQRLQLNTGLQTAINLLRADSAGLTRYLEEQAEANPHLQLVPPPAPAPDEWLPRWTGVIGGGYAADQAAAPPASLMAHVMAWIARMPGTAAERRIAAALADALEPSGWLGRPVAAIAGDLGVSGAEVEAVLTRLQQIEPAGLFARTLAECLALQLAEVGQIDAVMRVILGRLDLLAAGDLARLARLAQCGLPEIAARLRLIRSLDPKPGTQFAALSAQAVREPDLLVTRSLAGGWEVALNRSCLPSVRVIGREPPRAGGDGDAGNDEVGTDAVGPAGTPPGRERMAAARAVQRLLDTRNATLLRVGREVLSRQGAALEHGPAALVAMTMAEVAEAVGLHESTVSRVVAGTSVDTPRGTWWLRRLFGGGGAGGVRSGPALQARLERLIADEPRAAPLSDAALALALAQGGDAVARRTVAKYRAALNIPPAHRRRALALREKPIKGA